MKRFLLAILFLSAPLYADTVTTGNLKLLQPTTGYVDKTRSWADKLNTDLQIIDSSFTNMQGAIAAINASTSTFATNIAISTNAFAAGIAASTNAFATGIAASTNAMLTDITASTRASRTEIAISTNALAAGIAASTNAYAAGVIASTGASRTEIAASTNAFATGIAVSTNAAFAGVIASTKAEAAAVALDTTSINTRLLNGAITLYDNGVLKGNITTLNMGTNMSATISGSTGTIAAASGGGGGGGTTWQNLVNSSTIPTSSASSTTIAQGLIGYQTIGGSFTIRDWDVQYATGLLNKFAFQETATGTAVGVWKTYDTVFSTRFGMVGSAVIAYSTMGINNGLGLQFNGAAFSSFTIQGANLGDSYGGTTGKFSIETWIFSQKASPGNQDFFERNPGGKGYYMRWNASQQLEFQLYDGAGTPVSVFTSTAVLNAGSWNHAICTYNGDKLVTTKTTCFVNGNVCSGGSTDTGLGITINQGELCVGMACDTGRPFAGWIGLVATYDWPLDQAAASRQFQAGIVRQK